MSHGVKVSKMNLTRFACAREEHGLEPCREVVHDREVAGGDEEIADSHKDRYLLPQEKGRQHGFWRDVKLNEDKGDHEHHEERERNPNCG